MWLIVLDEAVVKALLKCSPSTNFGVVYQTLRLTQKQVGSGKFN